jgi:hypothetical protein
MGQQKRNNSKNSQTNQPRTRDPKRASTYKCTSISYTVNEGVMYCRLSMKFKNPITYRINFQQTPKPTFQTFNRISLKTDCMFECLRAQKTRLLWPVNNWATAGTFRSYDQVFLDYFHLERWNAYINRSFGNPEIGWLKRQSSEKLKLIEKVRKSSKQLRCEGRKLVG